MKFEIFKIGYATKCIHAISVHVLLCFKEEGAAARLDWVSFQEIGLCCYQTDNGRHTESVPMEKLSFLHP